MTDTWEDSTLPRAIVDRLGELRTLTQLVDELQVTDARVLWYLQRLESAGRVTSDNDRWQRTPLGDELLATPPAHAMEASLVPGRTVYDFVQAHAGSSRRKGTCHRAPSVGRTRGWCGQDRAPDRRRGP